MSRKYKTTIRNFKLSGTLTKLVKLSYLQSLAIAAGVGDIGQVSGVSESSERSFAGQRKSTRGKKRKRKDRWYRWRERQHRYKKERIETKGMTGHDFMDKALDSLLAPGNHTRRMVGSIQESGWSIVRQWPQAQFDIIRYAIGIRSLILSQFTYETVSEVISQPWSSPKEIQKVTLLVDQFIPKVFPVGPAYIEFYVKPDAEDLEWTRINPVGLPTRYDEASGKIVPRIISFNTEMPIDSRLEDAYITTPAPVRAVRFRALLKRPTDIEEAEAYSPVLKSYRLLLHPRGGL